MHTFGHFKRITLDGPMSVYHLSMLFRLIGSLVLCLPTGPWTTGGIKLVLKVIYFPVTMKNTSTWSYVNDITSNSIVGLLLHERV